MTTQCRPLTGFSSRSRWLALLLFVVGWASTGLAQVDIFVISNNPDFGNVSIAAPFSITNSAANPAITDIVSTNVASNTLVQVRATPKEGYRFVQWQGVIPAEQATANPAIFFAPAVNGIITAVFEQIPGSTLSINILDAVSGLNGIGTGTVQVSTGGSFEDYDPRIRYAEGTVVFIRAVPMNKVVGGVSFQSFVFEWDGDIPESITALTRPHPNEIQVVMEASLQAERPSSREITLLFSREYHPGEGVGDLDLDGLPDIWEIRYGLDPKDPTGENGPEGNLSSDFSMPTAWRDNRFASGQYPTNDASKIVTEAPYRFHIDGSRPGNYYLGGAPFDNWLQARGFDGWFEEVNPNPAGLENDDPRTNPRLLSTTGDGISDGWKYWFYASAIMDPSLEGLGINFNLYTDVNVSAQDNGALTNISNAVIRNAFRPNNSFPIGVDLDGDCAGYITAQGQQISDILSEFLAGTDPIHWDTDGDGISDGYEIRMGLNPLDPFDGGQNPSGDYMAAISDGGTITHRHEQVYDQLGFDPRTGWGANYLGRGNVRQLRGQVNTIPFNNREHFLASIYLAVRQGDKFTCEFFNTYALNPLVIDTDDDGIFDGWELYVGLNPKDRDDANRDDDNDGLTNFQEFSALDIDLTRGRPWPNGRQHFDQSWLNKVWPTDPNEADTDGDGISDGAEGGYRDLDTVDDDEVIGSLAVLKYANGQRIWNGSSYIGGGLNPTSVDTDGDFIPDHWEAIAAHRSRVFSIDDLNNRNGMDPTLRDAFRDYDGDGLLNYQEYLVGAVHHFRYRPDLPAFSDGLPPGLPLGSHDPMYFFTGVPHDWDWHAKTSPGNQDFLYIERYYPGSRYNSTNPRLADTDRDGMDDYWKLYHGLNPTYGVIDMFASMIANATVFASRPITYDIRVAPYGAGFPFADPDQDGLPNWTESLQPNDGAPYYYHTDPSPLWVTDTSYQRSWVNLYYAWNPLQPWYFSSSALQGTRPPPSYMFSFESVEGFDTDGDFIGDRAELVNDPAVSPGISDPLSVESPARRAALYLPGNSAARTRAGFLHSYQELNNFTIEAWVRPEQPANGQMQVILERPFEVESGNIMLPPGIRVNFRLGLDANGVPFVAYNGAGFDALYVEAKAPGQVALKPGVWTHLAGVYDGAAKQLRLYQNGQLRRTVQSAERPYNGWTTGNPAFVDLGPIVVGAADTNPEGWVSGLPSTLVGPFAIGSGSPWALPPRTQPLLSNHFRGWVDEIRIWNGARTGLQIEEGLSKSLTMRDVETSLNTPTSLMYLYNFNDLHDPRAERVAPEGFNLLNGRPSDGSYPNVPWWGTAADRSQEYTDYLYVPWIANLAARLPLDPPADSPLNKQIFEEQITTTVVVTNFVPVEIESELEGGGEVQLTIEIVTNVVTETVLRRNEFPNTANPYNFAYYHRPQGLQERNPDVWVSTDETLIFSPRDANLFNDLLPLRGARADISVELWDGLGTGGPVSIGTDVDANNDGIPDWWQVLYFPNFDPTIPILFPGDQGYDPNNLPDWHPDADPDGDGLTNYYEWLAGLDPNSVYSDNADPSIEAIPDGLRDPDGDGLNNLQEQTIGTHPLLWDTDDDGFGDGMEVAQGTDPTFAGDPLITRAAVFNGNRRFAVVNEVDDLTGFRLIEAWVKPANTHQSAILVRQRDLETVYDGERRYTLGLDQGVPFFEYQIFEINGVTPIFAVRATSPARFGLSTGEWVHVAGLIDDGGNQLRLYINGKRVAFEFAVPAPRVRAKGRTEVVMGGGNMHMGILSDGYSGQLDTVRIWDYFRSGLEVQRNRDVLYPEFAGRIPDSVRAPTHLFNFNANGLYVHNDAKIGDWLFDWRHAARAEEGMGLIPFTMANVETPWPPLSLDSDDDEIPDHDERLAAWSEMRSEIPLVYRALKFDGSSNTLVEVDELIDNDYSDLYALTNWTVEVWAKPEAIPQDGHIPLVRRFQRVPQQGGGVIERVSFELGLIANRSAKTLQPYARFQRSDANFTTFTLSHSVSVPTNDWTHLATSFSDGRFSLFVNGAEVRSSTITGARPFVAPAGRLHFGAPGYVGLLQDIRIWNAPRTADQVSEFYKQLLLFSGDDIDRSYNGAVGTYLGRLTDPGEDGLIYQFSETHKTHKFGVMGWIRMELESEGGIVAERKVETIAPDGSTSWLINHSLRITDQGRPQILWEGEVLVDRIAGTPRLINEKSTRTLTSEVDLRDGQWHHIAAVSDGREIRLYIDGEQDRSAVLIYPELPLRRANGFLELTYTAYAPIRSELRIADEDIQAVIDEVIFWNETPSDIEIRRYMMNGLDTADLERGLAEIVPLPAGAIDPGAARQRLVSYVTFDGEEVPPFVGDLASGSRRYRMLPLPKSGEFVRGSRPPISTDSVAFWRNELAGYFPGTDGGMHVENYMQRNHFGHAGLFLGQARFERIEPEDISHIRTDSSGDGIPDWWKTLYGLDPSSSTGDSGPWGDPDGDGLPNIAEFLAGTNPQDFDTARDGFSDYDSIGEGQIFTWGQLYTDWDGMADEWEIRFPDVVSPDIYDADLDGDGDGWSNYAEFMANTLPNNPASFPRPPVNLRVNYSGPNNNGPLVVHFYASASMDGLPVAVGTVLSAVAEDSQEGPEPIVLNYPYVGALNIVQGALREGDHWVFAFIDRDGNGTWNPGEPAGVPHEQYLRPMQVGWSAAEEITIGLTDKLPGYHRFAWDPIPGTDQYVVQIRRWTSSGAPIVMTVTNRIRNYIHEGDYWRAGLLGLPAGGSLVPGFEWNINLGTWSGFSMDWKTTLSAPVLQEPLGVLTYARNQFAWSMHPDSVSVQLQIRAGSTSGPVVYDAILPAPYRNSDGSYRLDLPLLAGDQSFTNGIYFWRLQSRNPGQTSSFSAYRSFTVDLRNNAASAFAIGGNVHYFGRAPATNIVIQAFANPSFTGRPLSQRTLNAPGPYQLLGLRPGSYYVRAFINQQSNQLLPWESWGFVRDYEFGTDYSPKRITVPGNKTGERVVIRDRDTNRNRIPDAWEVAFFGSLSNSSSLVDWNAIIDGFRDSSGDGLTNNEKIALGLNPNRLDTHEDGVADILRIVLGIDPAQPNPVPASSLFKMTNLMPLNGGVALEFDFDPAIVANGVLTRPVEVTIVRTSGMMHPRIPITASKRVLNQDDLVAGPFTFVDYFDPPGTMQHYFIHWKLAP